jgi:hypothetical protein
VNVNGFLFINQDTDWQSGLKKKIQPFLDYKKFKSLTKHCLKVKGWKKIFQANGTQKQAGEAVLIYDKADFKPKLVRREKEGHFIMIKRTTCQEDMVIVNTCTECWHTQFHETSMTGHKSRDRPQTNISTPYSHQ